MKIWFNCKAKYQKENEDGIVKNVTEPYLIDAFSYTEAESRIYEVLENMISGEFAITQITKTNLTDVFHFEGCDIWYKCKIVYYVSDGESEKEKKISNFMLVSAENVKDAFEKLNESLNNMLVTFVIASIVESPIVEVFPYNSEDKALNEEIPENLKPLSSLEE